MFIVFFRAIILYILVFFALRLMGKKQLGELQPSELVITILISNIASLPIEDAALPMTTGVIPILTLVAFEVLLSNVALKSKGFRRLMTGNPILIIHNGIIDQEALHKLRFSLDDLLESLRSQGVFDVQEVAYAVVETNGTVSLLQKFPYQSVTPQMLDLKGEMVNPPFVVISDGSVVPETMRRHDITDQWLQQLLQAHNMTVDSVFLLTVDMNKKYNLIPKEGKGRRK